MAAHQHDGVQVRALLRPADRRRLVHRRHRERREQVDGGLQVRQPVAEIRAERRARRRASDRTVTETSSKASGIGACGLCTRTDRAPHPGDALADREQPLRQRLDEVDRLAGDDRGEPLGEDAVVGGEREVVAGRVGDLQRRVDEEVLPLAPLVLEDAVKAAHPQPAQPDLSHRAPRDIASPGGGDPDGVGAGAYRVDAYCPGAVLGGKRGGGDRRGVAPVDRPRVAGGIGEQRGRGTTCGWCRPAAGVRAAASRSSEASSAQLCSAFLAKPMPGIEDQRVGAIPAAMAAASRSCKLGAHLGHHVGVPGAACMSKLGPRPCIRTYGTPRSRDQRRTSPDRCRR